MKAKSFRVWCAAVLAIAPLSAPLPVLAQAWEPSKTVEFIVPAGTGGGADQMARIIQSIIAKHGLMKQSMVVVNKAGGAGSEGFLDVKGAKGDAHKIIITLSNLFTTPLAQDTPFNWRDLTPVQMMALDQFVLWVNAETPYKTSKDYIDAAKSRAGDPGKRFKMGGTGAKQEDQIITVAIEQRTGTKFTYIPYKGGGEVAVQLVGKHVDSTVNNPIEAVRAVARRQAASVVRVRPEAHALHGQGDRQDVLGRHPDLQGAGPGCGLPDAARHLHARRRHAGPSELLHRRLQEVMETPDWKTFMEQGAFNQTALTGKEYADWVAREEARHISLMKAAGFMAGKK